MPRRRALRTPLGLWLEQNLKHSPFKTKDAFRAAVGVQQSTFNDWQRIDRASVPEGATVAVIAKILKLSPEKQAELNQVLVAQEKARRDASALGRAIKDGVTEACLSHAQPMPPPRVGERLRQARKSLGLTQRELARRAGIQREHLSNIETGKNKLTGSAAREGLAKALGLDFEHFKTAILVGGDTPRSSAETGGREEVTPSVAVSMGTDGCTIEVRSELGVILLTPRLARVFAGLLVKACDVADLGTNERRNDGC